MIVTKPFAFTAGMLALITAILSYLYPAMISSEAILYLENYEHYWIKGTDWALLIFTIAKIGVDFTDRRLLNKTISGNIMFSCALAVLAFSLILVVLPHWLHTMSMVQVEALVIGLLGLTLLFAGLARKAGPAS